MVKNLPCISGGAGLIPGWGTKITHASGRTKGGKIERTVLKAANSSSISCISLEKARSGHSGGCFEIGEGCYNPFAFPWGAHLDCEES